MAQPADLVEHDLFKPRLGLPMSLKGAVAKPLERGYGLVGTWEFLPDYHLWLLARPGSPLLEPR